jgi:hypothetical protein
MPLTGYTPFACSDFSTVVLFLHKILDHSAGTIITAVSFSLIDEAAAADGKFLHQAR